MAVIDELIIIEGGESKGVDSADNKTIDVINGSYLNNVDYHFAKENQVADGVCENAVNEPLIDMQIQGNSIQDGTPTPETPIEVQSVGEKTKNLINKDKSDENYFINSSGDKKAGSYRLSVTEKIFVKPSTTYVYSGMGDVTATTVMRTGYQYDANDNPIKPITYSNGSAITFTTEANCHYVYLQYVKTEETPMLEESSTKTEYEPYGYKVPIKTSGLNIADLSKTIKATSTPHVTFTYDNKTGTIEFTSTPTAYDYLALYLERDVGFKFEIGKTYYCGADVIVSGKQTNDITFCNFGIKYTGSDSTTFAVMENGTYHKGNSFVYDGQETIRLVINANAMSEEPAKVKFTNIYVSEVDRFEPYIEPTTTNIYLSEPLRKVGNYADYIDYKNKKVVRNIKELGISGLSWKTLFSGENTMYYCVVSDKTITTQFDPLCNILPQANAINSTDTYVGVKIYNANIVRARPNLTDYPTLEDWQTYLANNSMLIYYATATPTEEAVDIGEISTFDGTNIFDTETTIKPSEIKANYWQQI